MMKRFVGKPIGWILIIQSCNLYAAQFSSSEFYALVYNQDTNSLSRPERLIEYYGFAPEYCANLAASFYYSKKDDEKAHACVSTAIDLNPLSEFYTFRAKINIARSASKLAEVDLNKAVELEPSNYQRYLDRAHFFCGQKRFKEAMDDYRRAKEFNPEEYQTYYWMGRALHGLNDFEKEIQSYTECLNRCPANKRMGDLVHVWRGKAWMDLGDFDLALSDFEEFAEANSSDASRYYYQVDCLLKANRLGDAQKRCRKALLLDPDNSELLKLSTEINDQIKKGTPLRF